MKNKIVVIDGCDLYGKDWLYCIRCERFFQAKDLIIKRSKMLGHKIALCPFDDCDGAGIAIDLWLYETLVQNEKETTGRTHLPEKKELKKGIYCPLNEEVLDEVSSN